MIVTRRTILKGLVGSALLAGSTVYFLWRRERDLLSLFGHVPEVSVLGKEANLIAADQGVLEEKLLAKASGGATIQVDRTLKKISARVGDDIKNRRIVRVGGWFITESEAELAWLVALSSEESQ